MARTALRFSTGRLSEHGNRLGAAQNIRKLGEVRFDEFVLEELQVQIAVDSLGDRVGTEERRRVGRQPAGGGARNNGTQARGHQLEQLALGESRCACLHDRVPREVAPVGPTVPDRPPR